MMNLCSLTALARWKNKQRLSVFIWNHSPTTDVNLQNFPYRLKCFFKVIKVLPDSGAFFVLFGESTFNQI